MSDMLRALHNAAEFIDFYFVVLRRLGLMKGKAEGVTP